MLVTDTSWPAVSPGVAIQTKFVVEGLLLPGVGCVGLVGIVYLFWEYLSYMALIILLQE